MITVTEVDTLQTYLEGVISRADHHAQNVNRVALVLIGAVIWVKDERPIRVHSRKPDEKPVMVLGPGAEILFGV